MAQLSDHIRVTALQALDSIPTTERGDIYAVSLLVYDEEDDPRKPTVTVGFNTEDDVRNARELASDADEARWNYAFWQQNELAIICESNEDPTGAQLRERWARDSGLWYDLAQGEHASFNARGEPLTTGFIQLLIEVVQRLHRDAEIERIFGRSIPVLIHELEYYEEIASQNLLANPSGVVPEGFLNWCQAS